MDRNDIVKYKDELVFALDIGTRSVVGMIGVRLDGVYHVLDYEQGFHSIRAMRDGQVEDIELVSKVCREVKETLEKRNSIKLKTVAIAAAGRALKTMKAGHSMELDENESITKDTIRALEYSAIARAQDAFYESYNDVEKNGFQCVGYSVLQYRIDGYPIRNLENHKGKVAECDVIAAFLPFSVVKSLYAVTANCDLEVKNLTLEPIAAINVIVPQDVRLLNIAIADIGAGTSDIAISKDGSIIAYDMATTAGDEITESIMSAYLTDFDTAERVKKSLCEDSDESVQFDDILGFTYSFKRNEILEKIEPAVDSLADAISKSILRCNEEAPVAVFLIGGGSQIPGLTGKVADRLEMPGNRVALGGRQQHKHIDAPADLMTPEFVTPIGIGTVAAEYNGCDFFSITVNDSRIMLMHAGTIKVLDALLLAGMKASSLMGRSSRGITYFVNDQKRYIRGTTAVPGKVELNGEEVALEAEVKQGDVLKVTPAENGRDPKVRVAEIQEMLESVGYAKKIVANGEVVDENYIIKNMDRIELLPADETLEEAEKVAEEVQKAAEPATEAAESETSSEAPEMEAAEPAEAAGEPVEQAEPAQETASEPEAGTAQEIEAEVISELSGDENFEIIEPDSVDAPEPDTAAADGTAEQDTASEDTAPELDTASADSTGEDTPVLVSSGNMEIFAQVADTTISEEAMQAAERLAAAAEAAWADDTTELADAETTELN